MIEIFWLAEQTHIRWSVSKSQEMLECRNTLHHLPWVQIGGYRYMVVVVQWVLYAVNGLLTFYPGD